MTTDADPREELRAAVDRLSDEQALLVREWVRMLNRETEFAERRSASPMGDMLGVSSELVEPGRARFRVRAQPGLFNPHGVLHGGVIYVMVDSSMGAAVMAGVAPGELCTTIELKISYLQPVREADLVCETEVTKQGHHIAFTESKVRDETGRLVATASGSMFILRPDASAAK